MEKIEWAKSMSLLMGETKSDEFKNFLKLRKLVLESVLNMGCGSVGDRAVDQKGNRTSCEYCKMGNDSSKNCWR